MGTDVQGTFPKVGTATRPKPGGKRPSAWPAPPLSPSGDGRAPRKGAPHAPAIPEGDVPSSSPLSPLWPWPGCGGEAQGLPERLPACLTWPSLPLQEAGSPLFRGLSGLAARRDPLPKGQLR